MTDTLTSSTSKIKNIVIIGDNFFPNYQSSSIFESRLFSGRQPYTHFDLIVLVESLIVQLQTMLLFFVDAASFIDMDDDRWRFYLLYERYKTPQGMPSWRMPIGVVARRY